MYFTYVHSKISTQQLQSWCRQKFSSVALLPSPQISPVIAVNKHSLTKIVQLHLKIKHTKTAILVSTEVFLQLPCCLVVLKSQVITPVTVVNKRSLTKKVYQHLKICTQQLPSYLVFTAVSPVVLPLIGISLQLQCRILPFIPSEQFGFLKGSCTSDAGISLASTIASAINQRAEVRLVALESL